MVIRHFNKNYYTNDHEMFSYIRVLCNVFFWNFVQLVSFHHKQLESRIYKSIIEMKSQFCS